MTENGVETICPDNPQQWRAWLEENHEKAKSVWLIYYKKNSGKSTISWSEAVDEALCFGWIDSLARPMDEHRYMQFFTKRKPKSGWSRINKEKIRQLTENGKMTKAGSDCIELAKQNGSWTILDDIEELLIPEDLEVEFSAKPNAKAYFLNLSRSDKRFILHWLAQAKRPETRKKRLDEIIETTEQQTKPGIIRQTKKK